MGEWGSVEFLGVFLSAAAAFAFGAAWRRLLAERRMTALGRTRPDLASVRSPTPFIIAFASGLMSAATLAVLMRLTGVSGPAAGALLGVGLGGLVAAPWIVTHHAFAGRPRDLWWIDALHAAFSLTGSGFVLGLFL